MFESTEVGHNNDNISLLIPCLGLTQGTKPVNGMLEEHPLCIQRGSDLFFFVSIPAMKISLSRS